MRKIVLLLLFTFSIQALSEVRSYSDVEVDGLQEKMRSRAAVDLGNYLGEIKFSVFIKVNTRKIQNKKTSSQNTSLYLLNNTDTKETVTESLTIESVSAKVAVYEANSGKLDANIKSIVEMSIGDFPSDVNVSYLGLPVSERKKNDEESSDLSGIMKRLLSRHLGDVMGFVGVLVIAAVVIFGIIFLSRLVRSSLQSITKSLETVSKKPPEPVPQTAPDPDDKLPGLSALEISEQSKRFNENLQVLKTILTEKASEFAELVLESEKNASGMKKLLPYIFEKKYNEIFKSCLRPAHIEAMNSTRYAFKDNLEFFHWISEITEKMSFSMLNVRNGILSRVTEKQYEALKVMKLPILRDYLKARGSSLSYQITLDLLDGSVKESFIKSMTMDEWMIASRVSDVSLEDLSFEADEMIRFAGSSTVSDDLTTAVEIQEKLIIPSLVNIIPLKGLQEQDEFLDSLAVISKDVVTEIRKLIWTPRNLQEVPVPALRELLRNYDVEQKASIIASMPSPIGQRLLAAIPEGKTKDILVDTLQGLKGGTVPEAVENHGKDFIKVIFGAFKNSEFTLEVNGGLPLVAPDADTQDLEEISEKVA